MANVTVPTVHEYQVQLLKSAHLPPALHFVWADNHIGLAFPLTLEAVHGLRAKLAEAEILLNSQVFLKPN